MQLSVAFNQKKGSGKNDVNLAVMYPRTKTLPSSQVHLNMDSHYRQAKTALSLSALFLVQNMLLVLFQ